MGSHSPETSHAGIGKTPPEIPSPDSLASVPALLRALGATSRGLTSREAARRLVAYGPNELRRRGGHTWPRDLARQFTHPLALLLWAAAALALVANSAVLAVAIVVVIILNSGVRLLARTAGGTCCRDPGKLLAPPGDRCTGWPSARDCSARPGAWRCSPH